MIWLILPYGLISNSVNQLGLTCFVAIVLVLLDSIAIVLLNKYSIYIYLR